MALAVDYEAFWQRFNDGRGMMNDILNLGSNIRHSRIVNYYVSRQMQPLLIS